MRTRLALPLLSVSLLIALLTPPTLRAQSLDQRLNLPVLLRGIPLVSGIPSTLVSSRQFPNLKGLPVMRGVSNGEVMDLYLSGDQGRTWERAAVQPWPVHEYNTGWYLDFRLLVLEGVPTWVVSKAHADDSRLWLSRDNGRSWAVRDFPSDPSCAHVTLIDLMSTPARPERLWATMYCERTGIGTETAVFYTDDGALTWMTLDPWKRSSTEWLGEPIGSATNANLLYRRGSVWVRSDDGGAHWTHVAVPSDSLFISPNDARILSSNGIIGFDPSFSSADGGETWRSWQVVPCSSGQTYMFAPVFVPGDPQALLATCSSGEVFHSPDLGQTWSLAATLNGRSYWVVGDAALEYRLYAATQDVANGGNDHQFLISTDGGRTWQDVLDFHYAFGGE